MKDKISVIIPVYNVENYLARCIDSVLNQTYKNLEIILINDGSTDGSGEICNDFARKDHRVKVIHKENGGLSDARNAGMDVATGSFIGFVDSDDWIDHDMYQVLYNLLIEHQAEVSICRYREVYNTRVEDNSTEQIEVYDNLSALRMIIVNDNNFLTKHTVWNKLYRKDLVNKFRFIKGMLVEDLYFTPKVIFASNRCVYTDSAKYNYLVERPDSIMNLPVNIKRMNDELNGYAEIAQFLDDLKLWEAALVTKATFLKRLMEFQIEIRSSAIEEKEETLSTFEKKFINSPYKKLKSKMSKEIRIQISLFEVSPYLLKYVRNIYKYISQLRKIGLKQAFIK